MAKNTTGIKGLYLKHGLYVYQPPMVRGYRPPPIHLSTDDVNAAVKAVAKMREEGFVRAATDPLADLVEAFLAAKVAEGDHRGSITTETARPGLRRFRHYMRCAADRITPTKIRQWKAAMLAEGLSRATVAGYMRYAQSFMSWLAREKQIRTSPFEGQKRLFPKAIPTRRGRGVTKEQRDRLIANCDYPPLKAVLFIGFHAGLRRDEILNLRSEWIVRGPDGRPAFFHIQNVAAAGDDGGIEFAIKDAEPKHVPISRPLADFLEKEYGTRHAPYLIHPDKPPRAKGYRWDWKKRWRTYMKSQGLGWVTPHTMRYTWFTLLLSAPAHTRPSPLQMERWSGTDWQTIRKTYAHLLDNADAINAAN